MLENHAGFLTLLQFFRIMPPSSSGPQSLLTTSTNHRLQCMASRLFTVPSKCWLRVFCVAGDSVILQERMRGYGCTSSETHACARSLLILKLRNLISPRAIGVGNHVPRAIEGEESVHDGRR